MHIQIRSSRRIPIFSRIPVESNRKKNVCLPWISTWMPCRHPRRNLFRAELIIFPHLHCTPFPPSPPSSHSVSHSTRARHTGGVLDSLPSFPPSQHQALPSMPPSMLLTPLQRLCSRCGSLQPLGLPPAWQPPDCHPRCSQVSPL